MFLRPHFLLFLTVCYHTDATNWNQTKPVCDSVLGWTVWPSGRSDSKHRLWAQVLHRSQWRAHADQSSDQKHGFPARVRRDSRRFRGRKIPHYSGASSSSQHTAASTVPTLLKLGSSGTSLRKLSADYDSVASRTSIKETCANMDRETVVSSLFESVSKEKRDRDQNVVRTLKDRRNLHLEREVELAAWGEKIGSAKILRSWGRRGGDWNVGKKEILILLFLRSIRSLNPNDTSWNRRIKGLIRLKEIK